MFSKSPKRRRNLAGTDVAKKGMHAQVVQSRSASINSSQGIFAKRKHLHTGRFLIAGKFTQTQPVIFVTIDKNLDNIELNMSVKAEAAKKMFSAIKH